MPLPAVPGEIQRRLEALNTHVELIHEHLAHPGSPGRFNQRISDVTRHTRLAFAAATTLCELLTAYRIECIDHCTHDYVLGDHYSDAGDGRTIYEYGCVICGNMQTSWGRLPLNVRIPDIPDNQRFIHRRIIETQPPTPSRSDSN